VAEALIASPQTHAVAFTGSVAAGKAVAVAAASNLKPAVIEAGGSDPMIICASAPVDIAAAGAATAAFHLSGQVCTSTERIYAVDAVHDSFVAALAERAKQLPSARSRWAAPTPPTTALPDSPRRRTTRLTSWP
jgi:acyl-CoA reductase-like NAD-dependent aldehyde dehydrogenase